MTTYQLLPSLTDEQYATLLDDVREHGILVPVDVDEDGAVLDGHHRQRIAKELGIQCPQRTVRPKLGWTEAKKRSYALTVNLNRRHLTQDQRRQLVEVSLIADPELSDREHGRRTGVHNETVHAARLRLEATDGIRQLARTVGADGKERPATRPAVDPASPPGAPMPTFSGDSGGEAVPTPAGQAEPPVPPISDIRDRRPAETQQHVADAMDSELGKDHVAELWDLQQPFLDALTVCLRASARLGETFPVARVAHVLDENCVMQLDYAVKSLTGYQDQLTAARSGSAPGVSADNVLPFKAKAAS